jgi:hypothetical protein
MHIRVIQPERFVVDHTRGWRVPGANRKPLAVTRALRILRRPEGVAEWACSQCANLNDKPDSLMGERIAVLGRSGDVEKGS